MINNDFDTPIMYQDLANYSMGPITTPFGAVTNPYNKSLLGGTTMQRQLDEDKVEINKQKENQDKNTFKKVALGLGLILAAGFIPAIRKGIKNGNLWKSIKDAFKSTPKSQQPLMPKVKNWFGKQLTGVKNFFSNTKIKYQNNMPKAKIWFSNKWDSFKNLFKRKNNNSQHQPVMPRVKTWFVDKWDRFKKVFKK